MQVPEFWAEAREEGKVNGKRRVVRRFGWSETSQLEADALALLRAREALQDLQQGKQVAARERKAGYGERGLPIREEVVARSNSMVVTRNSYGARCLNEPDVLFADVDVEVVLDARIERAFVLASRTTLLLGIATAVVLLVLNGKLLAIPTFFVALVLAWRIRAVRDRLRERPGVREAARDSARSRIERAVAAIPGARFALYESPAGFRVLALHATADPRSAATRSCFQAFGTDPCYAQMCELQACFRARVSAKPWRIGVQKNVPPRNGTWPVKPVHLPRRTAWIDDYEQKAAGFAACRYLEDFGTGGIDPRCAEVQRAHDAMAQARTQLPLA